MVCDRGMWSAGVEASSMISSPSRVLLTLGNETTRSWSGHHFCTPTVLRVLSGGPFQTSELPCSSSLRKVTSSIVHR